MKREYCNRGFDNYYIITIEGNKYNYEINVLINNKFVHLLPVDIKACDNSKIYEYKINTMQPFKEFLDGCKLSYDELSRIIGDIIKCILEIEEYLLSVNNLIINVDDIFVDIKSNNLKFCYGEGYNKIITDQIRELIEELISGINPQDKMGVEYIYNLYEYMQGYNMSMEGFIKLANKDYYSSENNGKSVGSCTERHNYNQDDREDIQIKEKSKLRKIISKDNKVKPYKVFCTNAIVLDGISMTIIIFRIIKGIANSMDYKLGVVLLVSLGVIVFLLRSSDEEEKIEDDSRAVQNNSEVEFSNIVKRRSEIDISNIIKKNSEVDISNVIQTRQEIDYSNDDTELMIADTGDEETVLLVYKKKQSNIMLVSQKSIINNIYLNKQSNIIGSSSVRCNVIIQDSGISRVHATIFFQNSNWYITDLNSTNGTYVNNCRIQSSLAIVIKNQDKIAFAQSIYVVNIEM